METKATATGSIYALSSRIIFLVCGFTIHLFLARYLGPERYGLYGVVMSILIWVEFSVLTGIPSTYRKVISEDGNMTDSVLHSIRKLFIPYCLFVMTVFLLITPLVSTTFGDSRLLLLLLIAGIDIPFYGMFYAPIISFLEAVTMDVLGAEKKAMAGYGPGDRSALSSWSL